MFSVVAFAVLQKPSTPPKFPLTVESIMRGYALVGHAPRGLRWSADGSKLYFSWAKADGTQNPPTKEYMVNRDGTGLAPSDGGPKDDDRPAPSPTPPAPTARVYEQGGDIYYVEGEGKPARRLTETPEREVEPRISDGGRAVVFKKGVNVFRLDLSGGAASQLTDVRVDPADKAEAAPTVTSQSALADEQSKLFKDLSSGNRGSTRNGGGTPAAFAGDTGDPHPGVPILRVPAGYQPGNLNISVDGNYATFDASQNAAGVRIAEVPNYITRSGYTEMLSTYEKVGDPQRHTKFFLINLKTKEIEDLSPKRPGFAGRLQWSPDGTKAVYRCATSDHKDEWIYGLDAKTGKVSLIWNEHNDAWVGGPGRGLLSWLPDSSRVYFESERTGFANLMSATIDGQDVKNLTPGDFEVENVRLDRDHNRFLFVSSEGSPFRRHVDAMAYDGGPRTKLADMSADDDSTYAIANDGKNIAVVKSTANRPPELFVNGVQVTTTPTAEWLTGPWIQPEIVMIPARDGVKVPGHLFKPKNWRRGGPAVIFVHGAGYLQNVYEGWSYYYREYMFHHLLMSLGYTVLDLDYRASSGYGRDWRTAIYRHMGGKDLDDNVDGARWLVKEIGANPKRLGIYGGSYGGFITLMAMFTSPDTFAAGAALRPVSDWANYNHGYTSDILNNPQDDPEAYKQSSPIYFAEGLKGALLICHGMVDTNVHFQDSVRLAQRLIDLGKTNWELAPLPMEDHSFTRPESWTDEYRRILALFERTIGTGWKR